MAWSISVAKRATSGHLTGPPSMKYQHNKDNNQVKNMRNAEYSAAPGVVVKAAETAVKGRWFTLAMLTAVYLMSVADRNIFAILLPHIKAEMSLSDTQLGLLSGVAFGIFYGALGIPIAYLADRYNRRNIITGSLAIFSVMTVVCGMAGNFVQMLFARMGVGVGEAGTSPPSHAMLADYFPPERRTMAMGVLTMGGFIGMLVGFVAGGMVADAYGWRAAFYTLGLPGLLLSILLWLTVKEPQRGLTEGKAASENTAHIGFGEAFGLLWRQKTYRHCLAIFCLSSFMCYGMFVWIPTYLVRIFGMDTREIGVMFGLVVSLAGIAGALSSGWVVDALAKRDQRWGLWVLAVMSIAVTPFMLFGFTTESSMLAILSFAAPSYLMAFITPAIIVLAQRLAPLRARSMASAVLFFSSSLLGIGFGPLFVGFASDQFTGWFGDESLRYSLLALIPLAILVAGHCYFGSKSLSADISRVQEI
ncbi:TPA: MFS transporter [Pseudomonas aeruginosa]|nr:MFS transporter [Pseudomonas fluorescens]HBO1995418.1 MFS transporter [Pseudomonas aeruginosa]